MKVQIQYIKKVNYFLRCTKLSERKEIHAEITVKGLVQGVNFRSNTRRVANGIGLTGYVKNLSNGDVLIHAEGSKRKVQELVYWIKNIGSPSSRVDEIEVNWDLPLENYRSFRVSF